MRLMTILRGLTLLVCLTMSASAGLFMPNDPGLYADTSSASTPAANPATITLSTTQRNDLIFVVTNYSNGDSTAVTDSAGLNWTKMSGTPATCSGCSETMSVWYAASSGVLSNDTISVTVANYVGSTEVLLQAFSIAGANLNGPINGSPGIWNYAAGPAGGPSTTTTIANTLIVGTFNQLSNENPTAGAPWRTLVSNFYCAVVYQTVGANGTYTPEESGGNSDVKVGIAFAVAPSAG